MNSKQKILVVDDDVVSRELMVAALVDRYTVFAAGNAKEALELARREAPALVLLDIVLPGTDGYEVCRELRRDERTKRAKVLLVSGKRKREERLAGYAAGADDYLVKPWDEDELLAKVGVFLRLESAESLDRMKDEVLAVMAQELRSPVSAIGPAAEMLAKGSDLSAQERAKWASMVEDGLARISGVCERATLLGRYSSNSMPRRNEEIDLGETLRASLREAMQLAWKRDILVDLAIPKPVVVHGDPEMLARAFTALLDNAVRYSPRGGQVEIAIGCEGPDATFSITNQVLDLESARASVVFTAFAPRRAGKQIVGGGLNLALVRAVVEAHDGTIGCEVMREGKVAIRGRIARIPTSRAVGSEPAPKEKEGSHP